MSASGLLPSLRGGLPLAFLALLIVGVGFYTSQRNGDFWTSYNRNSLLMLALPYALIAMGQVHALLVGAFDISVGALVTMCVVLASTVVTEGQHWYTLLPGALAVAGLALVTGLANAVLVRIVLLPSIIATLATLSVLQGLALWQRPVPSGSIDSGVTDALTAKLGFVPYAFIGVIVLAIASDLWLHRTPGGLALRAQGFDETASRRLGLKSEWLVWRAFLLTSLLAGVAAFFWAVQQGTGAADASTGTDFTLKALGAAVLGGASLSGGRGSFVGAVLGALFLSELVNIQPLLQWQDSTVQILTGVLLLVALVVYHGAALSRRVRSLWNDVLQRGSTLAAERRQG